jgi:hypothetical protein
MKWYERGSLLLAAAALVVGVLQYRQTAVAQRGSA